MNKEEYIAFLNYERNMSPTVRNTFEQLIEEHFDPKPYKLEELYEGTWVWDDKNKDFKQISRVNKEKRAIWYHGIYVEYEADKFEENRFYPLAKANKGKEQ